jgi:uncharacterized protein YceH (UPF0502 family)
MNESNGTTTAAGDAAAPPARWQPIGPTERRVLGVLIEKAKTTPDAYPLSLNALKNGCNQKSNRFPRMELDEADVEDSIERLREIGAAVVIQGGARVDKYRHLAYDWLGVDKVEIAVMAELLLRGAQTLGELRGRAARMEPIPGLAELRPILDRLVAKGLVDYLTPPGRGAVVTHSLYSERELEKIRREYGRSESGREEPATEREPPPPRELDQHPATPRPPASTAAPAEPSDREAIESELAALRAELTVLKGEWAQMAEETREAIAGLRRDLEDLNRSLGNL